MELPSPAERIVPNFPFSFKRHRRKDLPRPLLLVVIDEQTPREARVDGHVLHPPEPPDLRDRVEIPDLEKPKVGREPRGRVPPLDPPPPLRRSGDARLEVGAVVAGVLVVEEPDDVVPGLGSGFGFRIRVVGLVEGGWDQGEEDGDEEEEEGGGDG